MPPKSERFELRIDEDILLRIDKWRGQQIGVPTRAEAMRRLMETGLAKADAITFSAADKITIAMLCQLFKHLKIKGGEIDADLMMSVLYGGHNWALKWPTPGMPGRFLLDTPQVKSEDKEFVIEVLDMWERIETAYAALPKKDKDRIAKEVETPLGTFVKFSGFDGHSEVAFITIARFLIEKLGNFASTFGGRSLDSHAPRVAKYRGMYGVFEPIKHTLVGVNLNTDQIIEILKAGK